MRVLLAPLLAALLGLPAVAIAEPGSCVETARRVVDVLPEGVVEPGLTEDDACRVLAGAIVDRLSGRPPFALDDEQLQPAFPTVHGSPGSMAELDGAPSFRPVPLVGFSLGVGGSGTPVVASEEVEAEVEVPLSVSVNPLGAVAALTGDIAAISRLSRFWDLSVTVPVTVLQGKIADANIGLDTRLDIAGLIAGGLPDLTMRAFEDWLVSRGEVLHALGGALGSAGRRGPDCFDALYEAEDLDELRDGLRSTCGIVNPVRAVEAVRATFARSREFAQRLDQLRLSRDQHSGGLAAHVDFASASDDAGDGPLVDLEIEAGYRFSLDPVRLVDGASHRRRALPGFSVRVGYAQNAVAAGSKRGVSRGFAGAASGLLDLDLGAAYRTRLHLSAGLRARVGTLSDESLDFAATGESPSFLDLRFGIAITTGRLPSIGIAVTVPVTDFDPNVTRSPGVALLVDWEALIRR